VRRIVRLCVPSALSRRIKKNLKCLRSQFGQRVLSGWVLRKDRVEERALRNLAQRRQMPQLELLPLCQEHPPLECSTPIVGRAAPLQ
jgi:hypothetical protein